MSTIVLSVVAVVAALFGYFIGSWSLGNAKEEAKSFKQAAAAGQTELQRTTQVMQQQLTSLSAEHEKEKQKINDDFKKQMNSFDIAAKSRDQLINSLRSEREGIQVKLVRAKEDLAKAQTPEQKAAAQAKVDELNRKDKEVATNVDGEVCANVKVPPSLLFALREGQPQ